MTTVTASTLYSNSWLSMKAFLEGNLTDPITGNKSSTRKWVYKTIPNTASNDFNRLKGYPFIVLEDVDISRGNTAFGSGKKEKEVKFLITIYTAKEENEGDNQQLATLSDELDYALETTGLSDYNLYVIGIGGSGSEDTDIEEKQVKQRTWGLSCSNVFNYS